MIHSEGWIYIEKERMNGDKRVRHSSSPSLLDNSNRLQKKLYLKDATA